PPPGLRAAHPLRHVLRGAGGGHAAGRAELQQQPGPAAGAAAGRIRAFQPDRHPPAAVRAAPGGGVGGTGGRRPAAGPAPGPGLQGRASTPRIACRPGRRPGLDRTGPRWPRRARPRAPDDPPRLAAAGQDPPVHHPAAGPGPRLVAAVAAPAPAGLPTPGSQPAAAARPRRHRGPWPSRPAGRGTPPAARIPPRRRAADHRLETQRAPRHPGRARVRTRRRARTGPGLALAGRAAPGAADLAPGRLGRPGRARRSPLPPAPAGPGRHRPRPRPRPPPRLPARAGPAAGGRAVSGPKAPPPVLPGGTRAWTLATAGLGLLPLLLILPPALAAALAVAAVVVTAASWRHSLPSWLRLLLTLAMLALVLALMGPRMGRDTGCALLAAMLAIKPAESHHLRDARSLLGFSLFAPFAAFLLDQGPLTMLLGLAAVLSALLSLQRLADVENEAAPLPLREGM